MTNLKSVYLPDSLRVIGSNSFTDCVNLETINLNDEIYHIGGNAFSKCYKLNLNALPKKLKEIGSAAFLLCGPGLTITSLPTELVAIPAFTFYGCENVKISTFGSNNGENKLVEIGSQSFQ